MKKIAILIAAALLVPCVLFAGPIKAGKWEVTMEMEMPGMPMKMPPTTFTHCITKEQAEKPEAPQGGPHGHKGESDCKVVDYKLEGNTASYKMNCEKQKMTGDVTMTFKGDSYEVVTHMKMPDHEMTQKAKARYMGECDTK